MSVWIRVFTKRRRFVVGRPHFLATRYLEPGADLQAVASLAPGHRRDRGTQRVRSLTESLKRVGVDSDHVLGSTRNPRLTLMTSDVFSNRLSSSVLHRMPSASACDCSAACSSSDSWKVIDMRERYQTDTIVALAFLTERCPRLDALALPQEQTVQTWKVGAPVRRSIRNQEFDGRPSPGARGIKLTPLSQRHGTSQAPDTAMLRRSGTYFGSRLRPPSPARSTLQKRSLSI